MCVIRSKRTTANLFIDESIWVICLQHWSGPWTCSLFLWNYSLFCTDLFSDEMALKSWALKASKCSNNIICCHIQPVMPGWSSTSANICTYTSRISQCVRFHHLFLSCLRSEWAYGSLSHMDSNSSMRCLVLPWRIWRRVLYLSRPTLTFSAWIRSLGVFLLSSTAPASSVLRNWKWMRTHSEWNPLPCDSLGVYSQALPISTHPRPPLHPHLLSIVIKSIFLLRPLCNIISCFGCEIETNFISVVRVWRRFATWMKPTEW